MSKLQPDEAGLAGVRRILQEWLGAADESLRNKRITDANIHDARKRLKKSRATLRLLRDAVGEAAYRLENTTLRDAARPLGVARDATAALEALDDLVERYGPETRLLELDKFRHALRQEVTLARQAIDIRLINKQRKALREVQARSERWRAKGDEWTVIGSGLERMYLGGRKRMKAAARSRDSQDLHDCRKQVKYLWHQLQILQPAWPGPLEALADQTHKLANHLGDDHDLAVLRAKLTSHGEALGGQDRDALIAVIDRRRRRLQDKAFKLGARIFAEKPRRFVRRIGRYWQLWRRE